MRKQKSSEIKQDGFPVATCGEFVIEKDVPIPDKRWSPPRRARFPFRSLNVGESFLITNEYIEDNYADMTHGEQRIRGVAATFSRTNDVSLSVRRTKEGFRVWRIR